MNSSPIIKLFDYIKSFSKNLCFVSSATLCSKSEGILPLTNTFQDLHGSIFHNQSVFCTWRFVCRIECRGLILGQANKDSRLFEQSPRDFRNNVIHFYVTLLDYASFLRISSPRYRVPQTALELPKSLLKVPRNQFKKPQILICLSYLIWIRRRYDQNWCFVQIGQRCAFMTLKY